MVANRRESNQSDGAESNQCEREEEQERDADDGDDEQDDGDDENREEQHLREEPDGARLQRLGSGVRADALDVLAANQDDQRGKETHHAEPDHGGQQRE